MATGPQCILLGMLFCVSFRDGFPLGAGTRSCHQWYPEPVALATLAVTWKHEVGIRGHGDLLATFPESRELSPARVAPSTLLLRLLRALLKMCADAQGRATSPEGPTAIPSSCRLGSPRQAAQ